MGIVLWLYELLKVMHQVLQKKLGVYATVTYMCIIEILARLEGTSYRFRTIEAAGICHSSSITLHLLEHPMYRFPSGRKAEDKGRTLEGPSRPGLMTRLEAFHCRLTTEFLIMQLDYNNTGIVGSFFSHEL